MNRCNWIPAIDRIGRLPSYMEVIMWWRRESVSTVSVREREETLWRNFNIKRRRDNFKRHFQRKIRLHASIENWVTTTAGTVSGRRGCVGDKEFGQREIYVPRPSIACLLLLLPLLLWTFPVRGRARWTDGRGRWNRICGRRIWIIRIGDFWGTFIQSQDSLSVADRLWWPSEAALEREYQKTL